MRITKITTKVVNISAYSNWIFVLVHTDSGMIGYGEATLDGFELKVVQTIEELKKELVGKNPLDNILPWKKEPDMIYAAAISGLDIALWDICGKWSDKPLYQLLGDAGSPSIEIPIYTTFNRALKSRKPSAFFEMAKTLVTDFGNKTIKCAPFDNYTSLGNRDFGLIKEGINRIAAIRDAVGSESKLMVDNHWRFNLEDAKKVADLIRQYDIFWFEAPVPEQDGSLVRQAKDLTQMRLAGFEMQTDPEMVKPFLDLDALDVYMPDIKYIGGITKIMAVNKLIRSSGKMIAPHNMTGPVATCASLQISATFDNLLYLEHHCDEAPYVSDLSDFHIQLENGIHRLNNKPGLGLELNMDELDKHPYQPTISFRENMLGG